jgi:ATP phosphoribosyltransferase regulatory subunit
MYNNRWLLPEGIEEILPPQAGRLEQLRRELLDLFRSWGYELVFPPFVEFLDSLLTGTGKDLDLQTFKITDQSTGRLMGVRADITPQAARIDAHQLKHEEPTRLCYLGTALRTRSDSFGRSRAPLQIGAELFGHSGIESDCEVLCLMLEMMQLAGVEQVHLDLGHVGIFKGLSHQAGLSPVQERALFDALQRKAIPEIEALLDDFALAAPVRDMLEALATLDGPDALDRADAVLSAADDSVKESLGYLQRMAALLNSRQPDVPVHYDLAELRAYHYQTGIVFAAFVPGSGHEIARGGRYDHIGESFGRARPATGFSADLLKIMSLSKREMPERGMRVFAPPCKEGVLEDTIVRLRAEGKVVVCALPGQSADAKGMGCSHQLIKQSGDWVMETVV